MCPTVPSTEGASDAAARRPDTVNSKYARGARERTCTRTAPRLQSAPIPRRGKIYIEFNEFRDRIVLIKKGNGFSAICIRYSISLHSTPSPTIKPPLPSSFFFCHFPGTSSFIYEAYKTLSVLGALRLRSVAKTFVPSLARFSVAPPRLRSHRVRQTKHLSRIKGDVATADSKSTQTCAAYPRTIRPATIVNHSDTLARWHGVRMKRTSQSIGTSARGCREMSTEHRMESRTNGKLAESRKLEIESDDF